MPILVEKKTIPFDWGAFMKSRWYWHGVPAILILLLIFPSFAGAQRLTSMDKKCQQESKKESVRCLEWRAVKILSMSGKNIEEVRKALNILDQARAISPLDLSVLCNIAHCYIKLREYEVALQYFDKVLKMKPNFVEVRFFKCMLEDRIGYPRGECRECYRSVAQYYKYRLQTDDVNYVVAELMLGGSNAERVKENFLTSLKPGSNEAEMWSELLGNFDREKFLHKMIP